MVHDRLVANINNKAPSAADRTQSVSNALGEQVVVHEHLDQEIVITTVDKLKLTLSDYQKTLNARQGWATPATLLLSLVTTLISADFKDSYGISSDTWQALVDLAWKKWIVS